MITIFDENPAIIEIVNKFLAINPQYQNLIKTKCITLEEIITKKTCDYLVIEGNSFGVMSSGLAYELTQLFPNIEQELQDKIYKPLSLGNSIYVSTEDTEDTNIAIIYTPTTFLPTIASPATENPLIAILGLEDVLTVPGDRSIYIPLFCVHSGKVPVLNSLAQICYGLKLLFEPIDNKRTHEDLIRIYNEFQQHNFNIDPDVKD